MSVQIASNNETNQSKFDDGAVPRSRYLPSPFGPRLVLRHSGVRLGELGGPEDLTVDEQNMHSMKEKRLAEKAVDFKTRMWMYAFFQ